MVFLKLEGKHSCIKSQPSIFHRFFHQLFIGFFVSFFIGLISLAFQCRSSVGFTGADIATMVKSDSRPAIEGEKRIGYEYYG